MFVIVVGGGRTGSHLAQLLREGKHEVKVLDDRPEVVVRLKEELPAECVVVGDGSDPNILEAAGVRRVNVLAAVTQDDEANLVVTSLARFEFRVPRIIARVNDPRNAWMFTREMGVDVALNAADILAKMIAEEMSLGDMLLLLKLRRGEYAFVEEQLRPTSRALGVPLKDMPLPPNCVIAAIVRQGQVLIPSGTLHFIAGDEILAVVANTSLPALKQYLG